MNTIKIIGTREEVYKSQAQKTIGGLTKPDILEKCNNGKTTYISKKLSDKMRLQINTIRENNPNFFKNKKRTHCVSSIHKNSSSSNNNSSNNTIYKNKKKSKTHKLSFEINNNKVKNIYYPELNGLNIEELKEEIRRQEEEENEEDEFENIEEFESLNELTEVFTKPPTKQSVNNTKNTNFVIEELSDEVDNFNINSL
jgi:hypothetical protein